MIMEIFLSTGQLRVRLQILSWSLNSTSPFFTDYILDSIESSLKYAPLLSVQAIPSTYPQCLLEPSPQASALFLISVKKLPAELSATPHSLRVHLLYSHKSLLRLSGGRMSMVRITHAMHPLSLLGYSLVGLPSRFSRFYPG